MKGLILKDIYGLKKQYKVLLALSVFYTIFSLTTGDSSFLTGVLSLMMVMLTITTLSYDERSKWDKYVLTMPVSRADLVFSKYLLGLILSAGAFVFNFIFTLTSGSREVIDALGIAGAILGISLFFLCVILPVLFKFGVEKGRLLMLMILFVPTGIIILLSKSGFSSPDEEFMRYLPFLCILFMVIVAYASICISLEIYRKKEM